MKLFSIILPIYNVERYIENCLHSIYTQQLNEELFEVIAVNDGSPDNSMAIVDSCADLHKNLRVVNKENGGVSSARNEGIKMAKGEYLIFVDPDDSIIPNSLNYIVDLLKTNTEVELFILRSYNNLTNKENYKWIDNFSMLKDYTGYELVYTNYIRGSVCGCVFKKTFIVNNNLEFPLGIRNFEDTIFMMKCMCFANYIQFKDIDMYNVLVREDSASNTITRDRVFKSVDALKYVEYYLSINKLDDKQIGIICYLKYIIISNITLFLTKCSELSYKEFIKKVNMKSFLPIKTVVVKSQKYKIHILNLSYSIYFYWFYLKQIFK